MVQNPQTLVKPSPASSPPTIFPQWICPIWSRIFSCRTEFAFKEMNSSCQASVHYGSIHAFWTEIIYWARSIPVHSWCSHIFENRENIEHPLIISIIKSPRIPQTLFNGRRCVMKKWRSQQRRGRQQHRRRRIRVWEERKQPSPGPRDQYPRIR